MIRNAPTDVGGYDTNSKLIRNLRIQFSCWPFNRIRRVLPDTASRCFHTTRPKPQLRKPAWLPFYTGGGPSLRLVLSAFIFRLPCGQQRSITPPCESNRPPPPLRGSGRPDCAKHSGIKPLSDSIADASLRMGIAPTNQRIISPLLWLSYLPTRRARPVVS